MATHTSVLLDIGKGLSLMVGLPRIASWDKKSRPQNPSRGTFGFNTSTKHLEYYDGKAWYGARMSVA